MSDSQRGSYGERALRTPAPERCLAPAPWSRGRAVRTGFEGERKFSSLQAFENAQNREIFTFRVRCRERGHAKPSSSDLRGRAASADRSRGRFSGLNGAGEKSAK